MRSFAELTAHLSFGIIVLVPVALAKLPLSWGLDNRFIRGGVAGDIRWLDEL